MTVFYNLDAQLGFGHTLPEGKPWLPGSQCDHMLLTRPYGFGPELWTCHIGDRHVEFVWLVPITKRERDFKAAHGLEALEDLLDRAGTDLTRIDRASVG